MKYPATNSLTRRNANSIILAVSNASPVKPEYTINVNTNISPAFKRDDMLFLPNIGFINIKPDIRIMISANSVSCAVLLNIVAMPSLLTPGLYQFKYLNRKMRQ